jgi:hypothetical protein
MAKYVVVHTYLREPEATWAFFGEGAPALAAAMEAGQTPAECLKTWNPMAHGRADYIFCLWEGEKPEDIEAVIRDSGMADFVTSDVMPVDEIDLAQLALAGQG